MADNPPLTIYNPTRGALSRTSTTRVNRYGQHVVALAEAARSGTRHWTPDQRERFANDPAGLRVTAASVNRSKGDQDPAHWLPERDQCGYVHQWVSIKRAYQLTADQAEINAINAVLAHCPKGGVL